MTPVDLYNAMTEQGIAPQELAGMIGDSREAQQSLDRAAKQFRLDNPEQYTNLVNEYDKATEISAMSEAHAKEKQVAEFNAGQAADRAAMEANAQAAENNAKMRALGADRQSALTSTANQYMTGVMNPEQIAPVQPAQ
mgnify:CR=1 FL=1